MQDITLGQEDWLSQSENIPRIRVHNMYTITNPANPDQNSHVSRPTLTEYTTIGDGPIMGIWQQDGTIGGDWLVISGDDLYRFSPPSTITHLTSCPGADIAQFAGTSDKAIVVRNGIAYAYDGTTIAPVVMPDSLLVGSVASIDGYFILSVLNDQKFYWLAPGDTNPDSLHFATAEHIPDAITSVNVLSDEIWFLGTTGPEVWSVTGDVDLPFQRIVGRVYNEGCLYRATVAPATIFLQNALSAAGNLPALIWVTDQRTVAMAQGVTKIISSDPIEELLKDATNLMAWGFRSNRHSFYILTADQFTVALDINTMKWLRWDSYLKNNWRAALGFDTHGTVFAGDNIDGIIWQLEEGETDNGDPVIKEVTGWVANPGSPTPCPRVTVRVNAGWTTSYINEPLLEMRWSDDQGATWSDYMSVGLGLSGQYSADTSFRSLGVIRRPGRNFEFRMTDPVRFRLDYAVIDDHSAPQTA